jgi:hypothetical protein
LKARTASQNLVALNNQNYAELITMGTKEEDIDNMSLDSLQVTASGLRLDMSWQE